MRNNIGLIILFIVMLVLAINNPYKIKEENEIKDISGDIVRNVTDVKLCQFKPPEEKIIILRMDDVQAWAWNKIVINLTDTVLDKNMSITLGVIPKEIDKDNIIKNYLINKIEDPRIEIAQHGVNHASHEFLNLSEKDTYDYAKLGLDNLSVLNVYPVTFIPPYDDYNNDTTKALSKLGFKIISSSWSDKEYGFDGYMEHIGYDDRTYDFGENNFISQSDILNSCGKSLQQKNICTVLIHPQNYAINGTNIINETRYIKFVELLDGLKRLGKHSTFRDLLKC